MPLVEMPLRGTADAWTTLNPVLATGDIGVEEPTRTYKIGDGITHWVDLPYAPDSGGSGGGAAINSGIVLPTGVSLTTGRIFSLTANDPALNAPPGLYQYDGTGWSCLVCFSAYPLGNLGAAPSYTVIPGVLFTATQNVNITTAPVFTFTRPGSIKILKTGAFTVVGKCTMAGRTGKELYADAWTPSGGAIANWLIEDDGTYIVSAATTLA